jgi:DNA-binding NarL/FixJ family response regulator
MSGKSKKNPATPPRKAKKVFIVEDHKVFREGLVQILKGEKDLVVCGQAGSAAQAMRAIPGLDPELILVDITLPGKTGLELIKDVRTVNRKVKMLVVSNHDEALYADRVLRAGGDGYIMKQEDPEEIINAIRDVLAGRIYVSEEVMAASQKLPQDGGAKSKSRPLDLLTDVELEILELLGRGKADEEIARQLGLAPEVVGANIKRIKTKLKMKTTNALVRYAVCWIEGTGQQ